MLLKNQERTDIVHSIVANWLASGNQGKRDKVWPIQVKRTRRKKRNPLLLFFLSSLSSIALPNAISFMIYKDLLT